MHSSMFSWYQTKLHMLTVVHWLVERTMSVCTWIGGNKGVPSKGGVNRRHIKMLVLQTSTRQGLLEKKVYFPRTDLHRQASCFTSSLSLVHCCLINPFTCNESRPIHVFPQVGDVRIGRLIRLEVLIVIDQSAVTRQSAAYKRKSVRVNQ